MSDVYGDDRMGDLTRDSPAGDQSDPGETDELRAVVREQVREAVSNRSFNEWYHERQVTKNVLEGKPYFNGASPPPEETKHTPSQLLQCHRKIRYRDENAPAEGASPDGIFWIGSEFEEGIVVPYLQAVATTENSYIRNSMWIDTTIDARGKNLQVRGATDPVITDVNGDPLLVTEIKTTADVSGISAPKQHHKAQLHAYLYGLTREYDYQLQHGLLLYGSRQTLDIHVFHVEFDEEFWWTTAVEWMQEQTRYRKEGSLPAAEPMFDWECGVCSYHHRCGKTDAPYTDIGPVGLLPLFAEYDRQNLREYLDAHVAAGAKLTPTLAEKFPKLASEYGSYEWECSGCGSSFERDAVEQEPRGGPPVCPACIEHDEMVLLSGPEPHDQLHQPD